MGVKKSKGSPLSYDNIERTLLTIQMRNEGMKEEDIEKALEESLRYRKEEERRRELAARPGCLGKALNYIIDKEWPLVTFSCGLSLTFAIRSYSKFSEGNNSHGAAYMLLALYYAYFAGKFRGRQTYD